MMERPPQRFQAFARKVIVLGAYVYFGHSAHLFQGIEVYRGKHADRTGDTPALHPPPSTLSGSAV
jgi:hypothetical protein